MLPSDNNSRKFLGLNFSNFKVPITAVTINGLPLQRQPYGFWVIEAPPNQDLVIRPPYTIELLGANGQPLVVQVPYLVPLDLRVQFTA